VIEAGRRFVGTAVAAGLLGLGAVAAVGPRRLARLAPVSDAPLARLVRRLVRLGVSFTAALLALLRRPVRALAAVSLTLGSWGGHFLAVAALMAGFGSLGVDADRVLLNWTAIQTAILVAPTPGFLGSFEAGSLGSLQLLGVDGEVARAYTVLLHAVFFGFIAVAGGVFLVREGWSLAVLIGESRRTGLPVEGQAGEMGPPLARDAGSDGPYDAGRR